MKSIQEVLAESEEKFGQDPDTIKMKEGLEKNKITQAINLIKEVFSEYSNDIIKYQEKYKNKPERAKRILKGIIPRFEQTANISSMAVPNNQDVKDLIQEKKEELEKLI